jgi:hypothetical protein
MLLSAIRTQISIACIDFMRILHSVLSRNQLYRAQVSEAMTAYRKLEDELHRVRTQHPLDSLHEDPILEEMAKLWWLLSEEERAQLDEEGPMCDPKAPAAIVSA